MIRILSWNIQAGGGSRAFEIVKASIGTRASIIAYNEFRNNEVGQGIRGWLLKAGYRYQAVTHAEQNENSVLVASQLPFSSVLYEGIDPEFSANIVTCKFRAFNLIGVYLPHKKKHTLFDHIIKEVKESEVPYIIAGDFNSGINHVDQVGDSFWYSDKLLTMQKIGYIDAFRLKHGDTKEYSWYSHQGNGFRYDHTYIDEQIASIVKDCYYNHELREQKLSDHSAMFLDIG